jgi:hypothetical protein
VQQSENSETGNSRAELYELKSYIEIEQNKETKRRRFFLGITGITQITSCYAGCAAAETSKYTYENELNEYFLNSTPA